MSAIDPKLSMSHSVASQWPLPRTRFDVRTYKFFFICACFMLAGCTGFQLNGIAEQQLNSQLNCASAHCPFEFNNHIGQIRLRPGHSIRINALTVELPKIKRQPIFKDEHSTNARTDALPRLTSFSFTLPEVDEPITRTEAMFVAFLLAVAQDTDRDKKNYGRNFSYQVKSLQTKPHKLRSLIRSFTQNMKFLFPLVKKSMLFDQFRSSWCTAEGKVGPDAPIDIQTLEFSLQDGKARRVFRVGQSTDWAYAWTVDDLLEEEINTSVMHQEDFAGIMYGFEMHFDVLDDATGRKILVSTCESLADVATRLNMTPYIVTRNCKLAPGIDAYSKNYVRQKPCTEPGDELVVKFGDHMLGLGTFVVVPKAVAGRFLLAPGDRVRFILNE